MHFFLKKTLSSSSFFYSSKFKIFPIFLRKDLTVKVEKTFLRNNIIWYAFYAKFNAFADFGKFNFFISKNPNFFCQEPKFCTYLRNLNISVAFTGKLDINFWWKFLKVRTVRTLASEVRHYQLVSQRKTTFALSRWHIIYNKYGQKILSVLQADFRGCVITKCELLAQTMSSSLLDHCINHAKHYLTMLYYGIYTLHNKVDVNPIARNCRFLYGVHIMVFQWLSCQGSPRVLNNYGSVVRGV